MLSDESKKSQFLSDASTVLEDKSAKFKSSCGNVRFWQVSTRLHCHRRLGRMFQSAKLLTQAAGENTTTSSPYKVQVDKALENIASTFGENGKYVIELQAKAKADALGFAKNPRGSLKRIAGNLYKLMAGSKKEKEEAKSAIQEMPNVNSTVPTEQDREEIQVVTDSLIEEYGGGEKKAQQAWSLL